MWVLKFRVKALDSIFGEAAKKFNLIISAYPVMHKENGKKVIVQGAGKVQGKEKDIKRFLDNLRKDKKVMRVYHKSDFFIGEFTGMEKFKPLYRPEVIWVKPAILTEGYEYYELASWDRRYLTAVIDCLKEYNCRIKSFKTGNVESISLTAAAPDITEKQRKAFNLAVKHGYYHFPKKIELKELAKLMGVNYSTYQAHLKKAESKIIPAVSV